MPRNELLEEIVSNSNPDSATRHIEGGFGIYSKFGKFTSAARKAKKSVIAGIVVSAAILNACAPNYAGKIQVTNAPSNADVGRSIAYPDSQQDLRQIVNVVYPTGAAPIISEYLSNILMEHGVSKMRTRTVNQSLDFGVDDGETVVAAADGWAVASYNPVGGKLIRIIHPTAYNREITLPSGNKISVPTKLETLYGHLSGYAIPEQGSYWVTRGQVVGFSGQSGMASVPGLSFSVWEVNKGMHINPHLLWADGPGKMTCYDPNRQYRKDQLVLTLPTKCGKN